jgi:outer membrane receptor protein involved in Fe transport
MTNGQWRASVARSRARVVGVLVAILFTWAADTASAQTNTGGIRGTVRDETGGLLAGVTVEVSGPALIGGPVVEVTNSQGLYRFERLPIGTYTVKLTLEGFSTVSRQDVRVEVGRSIEMDVPMAVGTIAETVTVSGASPVVDALHAGTTTNFNLELLQNIPSQRTSFFDTVAFMPAVRTDQQTANSATFILYGSSSDQNAIQIDGNDEADPLYGGVWDFPNPDIVQELQVVGVGASAEHTGFQGGIINLVTKSGGNTYRGSGSWYYTGSGMVGNNTPEEEFPFAIDYFHDVTGQIGGPIVKNKWWGTAIFELNKVHQGQVGVDLEKTPDIRRFRTFFKVNGKLSDNDSLEIGLNDSHYRSAGQVSRTRPPETVVRETGHNPLTSARWTRTMGSSTVFELRGSYFFVDDQNVSTIGDFTTSAHYDFATGAWSKNLPYPYFATIHRPQVAASLTHYANDFIKGSHDFKFGLQLSPRRRAVESYPYISNTLYYDFAGAPYYSVTKEPNVNAGQVTTNGAFVQDNWSITDRVTLNLGLRYDYTSADIPETDKRDANFNVISGTFPGIPDLIKFAANWSPRLGAVFKLDHEGRTVAKGGYGRYYGNLNMAMFDGLSPGNTTLFAREYDPATGKYDLPYYTFDPTANFAVNPNLRNQYTDQFNLGLEREVIPDLGLEIMYISKREGDWIRLKDLTGTYAAQNYLDTFRGQTQNLTVYNLISPLADSRFTVTNRTDFKQSYDSVVVSANKRLSHKWQLQGSYQWQRAKGYANGNLTVGSQDFGALSPSAFGRDPNDITNAYGRYTTDSTHSIKANFTYQAPYGIHFGLRESYETGRPYGRLITVKKCVPCGLPDGLNQGTRSVLAEPRGTYELPDTNNFQIRVDKDFPFGPQGQRRLRLSLDIINVFNVDTAVTARNNSTQGEDLFGQPLTVFAPRRALLGIRFEF